MLATRIASAQTPEVEGLLRHGIELRQQGNNEEALAEFQRAYRIARTPRTLAQVALAEQALGRWVDAETHLRDALRAARDPWITRNRAALDGALGVIAQHIGEVLVRCDVDGAELSVGERVVGTLPRDEPLRVAVGEVEVRARANGRVASQRVQVTAGETVRVALRIGQTPREEQGAIAARTPAVRPEFTAVRDPWLESTLPTPTLRRVETATQPERRPSPSPSPTYYRVAIEAGAGVGASYLSGSPAYAEQFTNTITRQPDCGSHTCIDTVNPGFVYSGHLAFLLRYNFSRRVGLGLAARIQLDTAEWSVEPPGRMTPGEIATPKSNAFANLLLGLRLYVAFTPRGFVHNGFVAAAFIGGGVGQIEAKPSLYLPPDVAPAAHVISGLLNAHVGLRVEYGFGHYMHVGAELVAHFMEPKFLFDLDQTLFAGVHF